SPVRPGRVDERERSGGGAVRERVRPLPVRGDGGRRRPGAVEPSAPSAARTSALPRDGTGRGPAQIAHAAADGGGAGGGAESGGEPRGQGHGARFLGGLRHTGEGVVREW